MAVDYPRVLRYVRYLIFVDFMVAFAGAFAGVEFYFWYATVHCGAR